MPLRKAVCMAYSDMVITLILDDAGRLAIPKPVRDIMHLRAGSKVRLDVNEGQMVIKAEDEPEARIERRGKRRVVVGWEGFDAAQAVLEMREDQVTRLGASVEQ